MRASEVHVRKSEFFTPPVKPYYANKKYDLYYPKAGPSGAEWAEQTKCLMTPELLSTLTKLDLSQLAGNVDVDKSRTLRYIKSLDEKLNSPQYEFLREFQQDVSCTCEETNMADAQCPCSPVKEPMNFSLFDKCNDSNGASPAQCFSQSAHPRDEKVACPLGARKNPQTERDELLRQTEALQKKLGSPEFGFLYLQPVELARCVCSPEDFPRAECACPEPVKPTDFRNKHDVNKKIQAMDGVLKSPEFGLSGGCRSDNVSCAQRTNGNTDGRKPCVPGCPPSPCRCGQGCPSMRGPFEKYPQQTFHVPDCPGDTFRMPLPRSPVEGAKACPFSPACCPIGDVCPFPVSTIYDPAAPPLPPLRGPRGCSRVPTDPASVLDPNRPDCPLNVLKPTAPSPPGCPLVKPSSCPIGQESGCPLLTCSLGPLKTFVFDGNDECPFCQSKCCPMISPDGPGCPIKMTGNFCPLGNTEVCALKGMSSPPAMVRGGQPGRDDESCPVGELLALQNAQPSSGSQPASSCYCAAASSPGEAPKRPADCPMATMDVRPPAPPCPLATPPSQKECPMAKMGGSKFDESCPVSNMFECPGLRKVALAKLLKETSKLKVRSSEGLKKIPNNYKPESTTHHEKPTPVKGRNSFKRGSVKGKNPPKRKVSSNPALQQTQSGLTGKTDDVMRKAVSAVNNSEPTYKTVTLKTKSSDNSYFEVSLEPLPRPPLSEYENTRNSFRKSYSQRTRMSRRSQSPEREDTTPLKAAVPDDSKGFQRDGPKPKPKNCPFPDPEKCPLEIPKCPFGPPEPSCPLAKKINCGGRSCCQAGMALGTGQNECPVETPCCNLFPEGHCPMDDMNTCECDFPVSPCMEPLIPEEDACAPDQYCSKLNCCMGLPLPPTKPSEEFETDTWYALADVLPGDKATKKYLEILNYPPEPEFFISVNEQRKHPAWKIIKQGEGYKQCKKIKEILAKRGPSADAGIQFRPEDIPDDEEIRIIEQNRINSQKVIQNLLNAGLPPSGWTDNF